MLCTFSVYGCWNSPDIEQIIGKIADGEAYIEPPFYIDYGCNINLGPVPTITSGDRVVTRTRSRHNRRP